MAFCRFASSLLRHGVLALLVAIIGASSALAQDGKREIRVATVVDPPFVMEKDGALTGFSIELWNEIATRLKLTTIYRVTADGDAMAASMMSKRADVAVGAIFMSLERDREFDFSYPILESGLQIMVRDTGSADDPSRLLGELLQLLGSKTTIIWLGIALALILLPAHLVWLLERRYKGGIVSSQGYIPGIFEAMYWAASTLSTQAEQMPRQWVARILAVLWMFTGVVFVALYTAQLTTTMTVEKIRGSIQSPSDLIGKRVATLRLSTAIEFLQQRHVQVQEFAHSEQMYQALQDKSVDAVVAGAPMLRYYAAHDGRGKVQMVGAEFASAPLAFVFQFDSPLRREVNRMLLTLRENGVYQLLHDQWFGSE
jgi:polar amino acid transport system substrate-binding protein